MLLHKRKQLVSTKGSSLQFGSIRFGVQQIFVLGPLLLVFINDVQEGINCHARLFADYCILYTEVNNVQDQVNINTCLKKVEGCDKW